MLPQGNRRIKTVEVCNVSGNKAEYSRILQDMLHNGGFLLPDPNWLQLDDHSLPADQYDKNAALQMALSQGYFEKKCSQLDALLNAWIGNIKPIKKETFSAYKKFLDRADFLNLWEANVLQNKKSSLRFDADLGSIMDLNLLYVFASSESRKATKILEVGGGYGRLAEASFNVFGRSVQYVMVDAVPASLCYAKQYLKEVCPQARVGSYYEQEGTAFDPSLYDISIIPAWHFEKVPQTKYDVCVNIESFQEMNQGHVDHYLKLFDTVTAPGATIYLSNGRDYYFQGKWNIPNHWQRLFCSNTPRSGSPNHPTEVFRKTNEDFSRPNCAIDAMYEYRVWRESIPDSVIDKFGLKRSMILVAQAVCQRIITKLKGASLTR